jgi:hypothetical protein
LASSILYNKNPTFIKATDPVSQGQLTCDYHYFQNKTDFVKGGLAEKYCDSIANEFCRTKDNTYIFSLFPAAIGRDKEVEKILYSCGGIIYKKSISYNNNDNLLFNINRQLYSGEAWCGSVFDNFPGIREKTDLTGSQGNRINIYLVESNSPDYVSEAKKAIRKIYNIDKSSVHCNDFAKNTLTLARTLFNKNGIHFMRHSNPKNFEIFNSLLNDYKSEIISKKMDPEDFCVTSSSILALLGLREVEDLDFLSSNDDVVFSNDLIRRHSSELQYYPTTIEDLLYNPKNHFWFEGVKFASIDTIKLMKKNRSEEKDFADLKLIKNMEGINE